MPAIFTSNNALGRICFKRLSRFELLDDGSAMWNRMTQEDADLGPSRGITRESEINERDYAGIANCARARAR